MWTALALNCATSDCAVKCLNCARSFLPQDGWIHLDVADGTFTFNKLWPTPEEWGKLNNPFNLEVHLMVEHPLAMVLAWIRAGAKRIIVHREVLSVVIGSMEDMSKDKLVEISALCKDAEVELVIAVNQETSIDSLVSLFPLTQSFLLMAIHPGISGQPFLENTLEKIRLLRSKLPNGKIQIDGGINEVRARQVKLAGADSVVSASYILNSENPLVAYNSLVAL